ncbi:MAG: hypothetical protein Q8P39_01930 [Candidatus Yanofskybacteria bacterium]|nr:hypothetical protein [Candidatus Yanofskybacteria bacterium]
MSFKEKIGKLFRNSSNVKQTDDANTSDFMKEYDERVFRGATSGKSYSIETFEKIWKLVNFSDKEILGVRWDEKDRSKIEKQLVSLDLKLTDGKSPAIIGVRSFEFVPGDTVDCHITLLDNRNLRCGFGFIDRKADKLVEWIEKKYGKSLKLRDDTQSEYHYDWLIGDVLITANIVKLSSLGDITFENMPGYAKVIRGEITAEEFFKKYPK